MQSAELKLIHFDNEDVIATSGGGDVDYITVSGLFDGKPASAAIKGCLNTKPFEFSYPETTSSPNIQTVFKAFNAAFDKEIFNNSTPFSSGNNNTTLAALFGNTGDGGTADEKRSSIYNGTYIWNGSAFVWQPPLTIISHRNFSTSPEAVSGEVLRVAQYDLSASLSCL